MYVYVKSEPNLYTVGFYAPDGKWNAESDHLSSKEAGDRVHYLNGGNHEVSANGRTPRKPHEVKR